MVRVYLDHAASSPLRPEAEAAVLAALQAGGNASSIHAEGRAARRRIEDAREAVGRLAGAAADRVIFTASATEANHAALHGLTRDGARPARVLVGATEHPSVLRARGDAVLVPVDAGGLVRPQALHALLQEPVSGPVLVAVQAVNNETGVIQNLAAVAELTRGAGALLHVDAVQAAGRLPLAPLLAWADSLALSAHKIGGPQGVGALVLGPAAELIPSLRGGGQERRRRAGTEPVALIAGFGAAALAAAEEARAAFALDPVAILHQAAPAAQVIAAAAPRVPHIVCFALPGLNAERGLIAFDLAGLALSSGSACTSGKVEPSHVLAAMNVDEETARRALRLSLGWNSTPGHLAAFAKSLQTVSRARA